MAAVRQVVEEFRIPLDYKKEFRLSLPPRFLQDESDRVVELWNGTFHKTVNSLCQSRRSSAILTATKRIVFASGMENVCKDFSRRTLNLKVEFEQVLIGTPRNPQKALYHLRIVKLTPIAEEVRQAGRSIVAEIPEREVEARAEIIGTVELPNHHRPSEVPHVLSIDTPGAAVARSAPRAHVIAPSAPVEFQGESAFSNPPVASAVTVSPDDSDSDDSNDNENSKRAPSLRERMQELETIKEFLSQEEYATARRKIIESI